MEWKLRCKLWSKEYTFRFYNRFVSKLVSWIFLILIIQCTYFYNNLDKFLKSFNQNIFWPQMVLFLFILVTKSNLNGFYFWLIATNIYTRSGKDKCVESRSFYDSFYVNFQWFPDKTSFIYGIFHYIPYYREDKRQTFLCLGCFLRNGFFEEIH